VPWWRVPGPEPGSVRQGDGPAFQVIRRLSKGITAIATATRARATAAVRIRVLAGEDGRAWRGGGGGDAACLLVAAGQAGGDPGASAR